MKKSPCFQIIHVFFLLCLTSPLVAAAAQDPVATVVAVRPAATARNASGAARTLAGKNPIFRDDVLKTDKSGQMQIMFTDNTLISIGRDSEMKIAEYRWNAGQKDGALTTKVKEGTFRVMGGALSKDAPHNFKTETPTATIGIRGSMYAFKSTPDALSVVFLGGTGIEVYNAHGKQSITVPGFGTRVDLNQPPERPHRFTNQELNELNSQLTTNGITASVTTGGSSGTTAESSAGGGTDGGGTVPSGTDGTGSTSTAPDGGGSESVVSDWGSNDTIGSDGSSFSSVAVDDSGTPLTDPLAPPLDSSVALALPATNEIPSAPDFSQPPAPPSDGIFLFSGSLSGVSAGLDNFTGTDTFTNSLFLGVNWNNNRVFGVAYEDTVEGKHPVFFFGSTSGSTVTDLTIFGADKFGQFNEPGFISGSGTGAFSGTGYDFFSFNAVGNTYLIDTSTLHDSWTVGGGAQQTPGSMTPVAPKGTEIWQGFSVGISVDMDNLTQPGIYRSAAGAFPLTVNKDAGTISGSMSPGTVFNNPDLSTLTNIQIGGDATRSVYLQDNLLAALIDPCVGGGCEPAALKTYGNYMVVAGPEKQFSSYVTWGYWEIAYTDDGLDRFMSLPYSMWIAGNPSTNAVIKTGFTGTYSGSALGTKVVGNTLTPLSGTFNLTAEFDNFAMPISGNITFPGEVTLTVVGTSGTISANAASNSFFSELSGGGTNGTITGAFFGPDANAVGGNFYSASGGSSLHYVGIFGGNKQ